MATGRIHTLTPPGAAAIAVLRISGGDVPGFLARFFSARVVEGRCIHGTLADETGNAIDDPVVVLLPGAAAADLCVHGGPQIVEETVALAARNGFQFIPSGEDVALEAVDGETLLEREVMSSLPLPTTEAGIRALLAQPAAWRRWLAGSPKSPPEIEQILNDRSLFRLLHPPRVAIVGAANVGKSTLANALFAQQRSITADIPGTTRDWVGEPANLDGLPILLIDTPGLRNTSDAIERQAMERSAPVVQSADLIVVVLDATRPLEPEQANILRRYPDAIVVINKTDRRRELEPSVAGIETVATTGTGVDELRLNIRRRFQCEPIDLVTPRCWTNRQMEILARASVDSAALDLI